MNRISKDLKKDADKLLPDEQLKENIKSRLFPSPEPRRAKSKRGIAVAMSAVVCVLVIAIALGVIFSVPTGNNPPISAGTNSDTLVLIDINPSFEIVADKNGLVKSVTGVNSDARIVLLGKDYTGKPVDQVCTDIVKTSINLGYVNNKHGQVNIAAYNEDSSISSEYISLLTGSVNGIVTASGGTVVGTDGEAAKQKLIDEIIAAYGTTAGLDEKTVLELHRILKQYDVTKEQELDKLEDLWEEELEKAGFDDDTMEDIIDKWKEENLKPLGEELEEELEYYIDLYEVKLVLSGISEDEAERAAKEKEAELTQLGREDRTALRAFIDTWWTEAENEFYSCLQTKLKEDGKTQAETDKFTATVRSALEKKDLEDKKEIIADFLQDYYENIVDPDEDDDDFWQDFLEDLFEDDDD